MTPDRGDGWADQLARADAQRDEAEDRAARYLALVETAVRHHLTTHPDCEGFLT